MERPCLDLTPRFDREAELAVLPHDLAVLMVGIAARQAASATAAAQAETGQADTAERRPRDRLFQPGCGAFNGEMAAAMARWREE